MAKWDWGEDELPANFFRIIMPSVLRKHKLPMPIPFVMKYGGELSRVIRIKVPAGVIWWKVGIERGRGGKILWFSAGWQKFMEHHNIGFGYFLTFKYTGNSEFHVHIFDLTATEIDYPPITTSSERPAHINGDGKKIICEARSSSCRILNHFKSRQATAEERKRAVRAAGMFKPDNPSFIVAMQYYNVNRLTVHIPSKFVGEHLHKVPKDFELEDSDGRKWPVRCIIRKDYNSCLSKGWGAFVKGNKLEEGDVCVFELIQTGESILKVSVFRAKEEMHDH